MYNYMSCMTLTSCESETENGMDDCRKNGMHTVPRHGRVRHQSASRPVGGEREEDDPEQRRECEGQEARGQERTTRTAVDGIYHIVVCNCTRKGTISML